MLTNKVETLTILFADTTTTSTNLELQWAKLSISFPITTEINTKVK